MNLLFYTAECSSTNDEINRYLLYPEADFTALYTFNQKKGRGQYGNTWNTNANENIAYSVAIKAAKINLSAEMLNYYTAIIFRDFIANLTQTEVFIKWPNDIIIQQKKVAGILIEKKKINNTAFYITGIGINVLQKKFEFLTQAGSLYTQTGKNFDLKILTQNLHEFFISRMNKRLSDESILKVFNMFLFRKDTVSVFEIDEIRQNGIVRKALSDGKILIELESGLQTFYHKEIKLLY